MNAVIMKPMSNIVKKLVISTLITIFVLIPIFTPIAHAQSETGKWYDQSFQEWYGKVYDPNTPATEIFGERYTAAQVQWVIYGLFALMLRRADERGVVTCFMQAGTDCVEKINDLLSSLPKRDLASQKNLPELLFEDRPLSGITYFKNLARKFHIIPEAQAQAGFGFNALDPVLPIWRVVRNITYSLFVFVILVVAFMIMFRVKISPQVVITVQSAIPKIAIGLILVTFSYAIAGFLVDIMYVVIALLSLVLSLAVQQASGLTAWGPTVYFETLTKGPFGTGIFGFSALYAVFFIISMVAGLFGSNGIVGFIGSYISLVAGFLSFLASIITILMIIILLIAIFRIIWMLIKTFANILILTIFAPVLITLGIVVPNAGFGDWVRKFVSNLAVFPVTGFLFILAYTFCIYALVLVFQNFLPSGQGIEFITNLLEQFLAGTILGPVLAPQFGEGWPPLLGIGKSGVPLTLVGASLVIVFIIPKINEAIQAFIEGKPFAYGAAVGEAFELPRTAGEIAAQYKEGLAKGVYPRKIAGVDIEPIMDRLKWLSYIPKPK